jgi:hypothetical protein
MSRIRLHHSEEANQALALIMLLIQKRTQNPLLTLQNPLWIVCPALAQGNWLKKELLKNVAPLFNVQFITPPTLRKLLTRSKGETQRVLSPGESKWLARTFLRTIQ